jgi:hypothetical protein
MQQRTQAAALEGSLKKGVHEMNLGTMVKIIREFDHSIQPHYIELLE